jgi:hypothetical protein
MPDIEPTEGFQYPEDLTALSAEELSDTEQQAIDAFDGLASRGDDLTEDEVTEMERLAEFVASCREESTARQEAAAERRARADAAAQRIAPAATETPPEEGDPDQEPEEPGSAEDQPEAVAASARGTVVPARRNPPANPRPARPEGEVVITAGADISGIPVGARLDDLLAVARAFMARSKGFVAPSPSRTAGVYSRYGVATLARPQDPDGLRDDNADFGNVLSLIDYAKKESRLPNGSLTAAGGWCAPSETLYGLCQNESLDGMLDTPEVTVTRGGIRFTPGPDFAQIYGSSCFFALTEAQVEAGTQKNCCEVDCPDFEEVRLDAVGFCVKSPILTRVGYPELVQRWLEGTVIANAHKVNARKIASIATALGTATDTAVDGTSVTRDSLTALELASEGLRYKYRMGRNDTMEGVAPFWLRTAIRGDLANRTGQPFEAVSNAQIDAHFNARNIAMQWVYDWQDTTFVAAGCVVDFPATVEVMLYPAGTFITGVQDVINLDTIYDTTDLLSNMYTAAFAEDGMFVAQTCFQGCRLTIPVCVSGRTGAADITECYGAAATP